MASMTREQFDEWIERARPEALPYVARILKNRGSMLPKLRRLPDRHNDYVLDFGEEEDIFNAVVLTLLGYQGEDDDGQILPPLDPPPYTTFPSKPDDFEHFKAWLFKWLENAARNEDRRESRRRTHEVSSEGDRQKVRKRVQEMRPNGDLDPESILEDRLIHRARAETRQEYRQIEDDNIRRPVRDANSEEDEVAARRDDGLIEADDPRRIGDIEGAWTLLTDFTLDIDGVTTTSQRGRPLKWDEGAARALFFEWHHMRHALRCAYGNDLARRPDEPESTHVGRVTGRLLELDREWVHPDNGFSPLALAVPTPGPTHQPEPGYQFLFRIVDPEYPVLTATAATQIAQRTGGREGALALELIAYYHNLRRTQIKSVLEKARTLTPGAARKRA